MHFAQITKLKNLKLSPQGKLNLCDAKLHIQKITFFFDRFSEQKFDTSGKEPPNGYTTVARVLDIKEATVFNYIMDKARVECVILFEQDDVARNEMYPNV
jgi:hypothetical protein